MSSNIIGLAGFSGSGKSTSLKYLTPESTFIISCTNKQLQIPGFRKKYPKAKIENTKLVGNWLISNNYANIEKIMKIISNTRPEIKTIVIDDANYLLSNETFATALDKGYTKFSVMAKNYYDLLMMCQSLRDGLTVVFMVDVNLHQLMQSTGLLNVKNVVLVKFFLQVWMEMEQKQDMILNLHVQ